MARMFSIPYNGEEPEIYMENVKKYRENIHDVYLGTPLVQDFFQQTLIDYKPNYYENSMKFLALAQEKEVPVVLTANASYNDLGEKDKNRICRVINYLIQEYDISGVVISDLDIAEILHRIAPDVELNTSCNNPHYNAYSLIEWRDKAGVNLINPPRDTVRDFKYLKELKEHGFRVKLLINEFCYLNCGRITQFCSVSKLISGCRSQEEKMNPLLSCTLFPQQLEKYDEVVDIYKIQGRWMETEYIFNILDTYISGKPLKISELRGGRCVGECDFMTDEIDPKLVEFWLNCPRDCYKCGRCAKEYDRLKEKYKVVTNDN